MVAEGAPGKRGVLPSSTSVRLSIFLPSPGRTPDHRRGAEGESDVEVGHARCAGIDVSKRDAKVCIRIAGAGRRGGAQETVTTWGSVTGQALALRDHLLDQRVTCVVMEATGDYRKPFYYLLEDASFEVLQRLKGWDLCLADHGRRACPSFGVAGRSMPGG